jgi:hypothetical protein
MLPYFNPCFLGPAVAAALNWVLKDGLGQLGGVLYASLVGERFDSEPKRIRFWAGWAMQGATLLELLLPLAPHLFLPIASVANIGTFVLLRASDNPPQGNPSVLTPAFAGRNIAWLAGSATRAQIHNTFALHDNLGDITAKAGSQSTAASVLGTGVGILGM